MSITALKVISRGLTPPENFRSRLFSLYTDDLRPVKSKTGRAKILSSFEKVPFEFRFFFLNRDNDAAKEKIIADQVNYPNSIQVIYQNNVTTVNNYMPLTAWILAHRMGHLDILHHKLTPYKVFNEIISQFDTFINIDGRLNFEEERWLSMARRPMSNEISNGWVCAVQPFLNTRAARRGRISNGVDVFAEMVAQYVITGKIKLATIGEVRERVGRHRDLNGFHVSFPEVNYVSDASAFNYLQVVLKYHTDSQMEELIARLESTMEKTLHEWISALQGNTWAF